MIYNYTSLWKSRDADSMALQGVLVAGGNEVGCYFPDDSEEQQEWTETIQQIRQKESVFAPREWLQALAKTGNGITIEFAEIDSIESSSLALAMTLAYQNTFQHYGSQMALYGNPVDGWAAVSHDPLSSLLPELSPVSSTTRR